MAFNPDMHIAETAAVTAQEMLKLMFSRFRVYLTEEQTQNEIEIAIASGSTLAFCVLSTIHATDGILTYERFRALLDGMYASDLKHTDKPCSQFDSRFSDYCYQP